MGNVSTGRRGLLSIGFALLLKLFYLNFSRHRITSKSGHFSVAFRQKPYNIMIRPNNVCPCIDPCRTIVAEKTEECLETTDSIF